MTMPIKNSNGAQGHDIVVIGASAGGVSALTQLVSGLPSDLPAALFVVLHVSFWSNLPEILSKAGPIPAIHPRDGQPIEKGRIYVAPPDYHLILADGTMRLEHGPKENRHRPAIDTLFRSAAHVFGPRAIGIVLTGTQDDGTRGLYEIKKGHGVAVVQEPLDAQFPDMPLNALRDVDVDHVLPVSEISHLLGRWVAQQPEKTGGPVMSQEQLPERLQKSTCPSCDGPIWESMEGSLSHLHCRVGHRFQAEGFLIAQAEHLERTLWVALQTLEGRAELQERTAVHASEAGQESISADLKQQSRRSLEQAKLIRQILEITPAMEEPAGAARKSVDTSGQSPKPLKQRAKVDHSTDDQSINES
jgi:two-component system chemotaxis response regulator CheB